MFSVARFELLILFGVLLVAAPNHAGQRRGSAEVARDVRHTLAAQKLLADDPELAVWNIGVTVTNRVGVLWGPVPSADLAYRAEMRLRILVELVEIRNDLFVSPLVEPMRVPLKIDNPPAAFPEEPRPRLPARPRTAPGAPGKLTGQDRGASKKAGPASKTEKPPTIEVLPPEKLDPAPVLPRRLPAGKSSRNLEAQIRDLLQSKSTYRPVEFAIEGRRVFLKSTEVDALHEAARAISRLPSVESVVLQDRPPSR
ncbi:MAG: hypothetical protein HYX68_08430 [Planctomycetes bacterium]|nr:hypothetical protein [Planctomycetota bacterium]